VIGSATSPRRKVQGPRSAVWSRRLPPSRFFFWSSNSQRLMGNALAALNVTVKVAVPAFSFQFTALVPIESQGVSSSDRAGAGRQLAFAVVPASLVRAGKRFPSVRPGGRW